MAAAPCIVDDVPDGERSREQLSFTHELTGSRLSLSAQARRSRFEGHAAMERWIPGAIDVSERSATHTLENEERSPARCGGEIGAQAADGGSVLDSTSPSDRADATSEWSVGELPPYECGRPVRSTGVRSGRNQGSPAVASPKSRRQPLRPPQLSTGNPAGIIVASADCSSVRRVGISRPVAWPEASRATAACRPCVRRPHWVCAWRSQSPRSRDRARPASQLPAGRHRRDPQAPARSVRPPRSPARLRAATCRRRRGLSGISSRLGRLARLRYKSMMRLLTACRSSTPERASRAGRRARSSVATRG